MSYSRNTTRLVKIYQNNLHQHYFDIYIGNRVSTDTLNLPESMWVDGKYEPFTGAYTKKTHREYHHYILADRWRIDCMLTDLKGKGLGCFDADSELSHGNVLLSLIHSVRRLPSIQFPFGFILTENCRVSPCFREYVMLNELRYESIVHAANHIHTTSGAGSAELMYCSSPANAEGGLRYPGNTKPRRRGYIKMIYEIVTAKYVQSKVFREECSGIMANCIPIVWNDKEWGVGVFDEDVQVVEQLKGLNLYGWILIFVHMRQSSPMNTIDNIHSRLVHSLLYNTATSMRKGLDEVYTAVRLL